MKINRGKLIRRSILVLLVLGAVAVYFADRFVKTKGFDGLGEFITNYYHNKSLSEKVTPKELKIEVDDSDFEFLKKRRQEGLERGIQINDGDNYVPCQVIFQGDTVDGEMRLKGHMTDHLEGEKWSYRVKTEKPVMGMYRFSLQHPGNRNYYYEWIYHQLLREEGVIALQYDFLNFTLNENDLGIYAVEEHFGQHVLESNDRPKGAIIRWNPELYWEWRIDELQGLYLDEQYSAYSSSFAEPYDRGVVFKDSILTKNYLQAARKLELFRRGRRSTSEVFDVEKMAIFHAVIDLVGGHHSLDWSDVKFYYNSASEKLEPVGYESFSIRKTERLAGQQAIKNYEGLELDYHERLFSDPVFFAAYIQALERICQNDYFNLFTAKIQTELDEKIGVVAHEFPYIRFSYDGYYENIELIQHNLSLPKPFHAFTEEVSDSTVRLSISPVSDFPIEITALVAKGKRTYSLPQPFLLPAKARETYAHYFNLIVPHDGKKMKDLTLKARILGSSREFEVEVAKYPSYEGADEPSMDTTAAASLYFDILGDSLATFKSRSVTIEEVVELPKNVRLMGFPGQEVNFRKGGAVVIQGAVQLYGYEENEIRISSTSASKGFVLVDGSFHATHLSVANSMAEFITAYRSTISIQSSSFIESEQLIYAEDCHLEMKNNQAGSIDRLLQLRTSTAAIEQLVVRKSDHLIFSQGSEIRIRKSEFSTAGNPFSLNKLSTCRVWDSYFSDNETIARLNDASSFYVYGSTLASGKVGVELDTETQLPGKSTYLFHAMDVSGLETVEKN